MELAGALLDTSDAPKAFRECSGGLSGTLRRGLGSSRRALGSLRGRSGHLSRAILGGSETARSENGDMLENDDPYGTFAMFSRSRGLRNGPEMLPEAYFSDVRVQTSAEGVSGSVVGASRELQDGVWTARWQKSRPPWTGKADEAGRVLHANCRRLTESERS